MRIHVRLGSGLATVAGTRRLSVELHQDATVEQLLAQIRVSEPTIASALDSALPVVGGAHVSASRPLADGDEVALLIPVAGGAPGPSPSRGATHGC